MLSTAVCLAAALAATTRFDHEGDPLPREALRKIGSSRFRVGYGAYSAVFSPDGRAVYTVNRPAVDGWDLATGRRTFRVQWPDSPPFGYIRPSAEGLRVWCYRSSHNAEWEYRYRVLDPRTGRTIRDTESVLIPGGGLMSLSPRGSWYAVSAPDPKVPPQGLTPPPLNELKVYRTDRIGEPRTLWVGPYFQSNFSPDDRYAAVRIGPHLMLFDPGTGRLERSWTAPGQCDWPAFTRDGRRLAVWASNGNDSEFYVWDLDTPAPRRLLTAKTSEVLQVKRFTPDGRSIAALRRGRDVVFVDAETGRPVRVWEDVPGWLGPVSPDGKVWLAIPPGGQTLIPLDAATGRPTAAAPDPPEPVIHLTARPDGAVVGLSGTLVLAWDPATGRELSRADLARTAPGLSPCGLSPDAETVALVSSSGTAGVLADARSGKLLSRWDRGGKPIGHLGFVSRGKELVGWADERLWVWDTAGRLVGTEKVPRSARLDLSPGGRLAATAEPGGRITVYHLGQSDRVVRLSTGWNEVNQLLFTRDNRLLVAVGRTDDGHAHVAAWITATGQRVQEAEVEGEFGFSSAALSPDGRVVAASVNGRTVLIEMASGRVRHRLSAAAADLTFTADGRYLVTASPEVPVYVWDVRGELSRPTIPPDRAALDAAWVDLSSADAARAFRAVRLLAAFPNLAVPLLRERLAAVGPDPRWVAERIGRLDSPVFAERERATAELREVADQIEPALKAAAAGPSAEVRRRAEELLVAARAGGPATLRSVRAVEAVEWASTPEAV